MRMRRKAFTLIKLLVVTAIIAILLSMLVPNHHNANDIIQETSVVKCVMRYSS